MKKQRKRTAENSRCGTPLAVSVNMENEHTLLLVSQAFKAMGDITRVKIICALLNRELCVHEIADILQISSSAISHQLRILRNLSLVKYSKKGKEVFYALDDEHIEILFKECLIHVKLL